MQKADHLAPSTMPYPPPQKNSSQTPPKTCSAVF